MRGELSYYDLLSSFRACASAPWALTVMDRWRGDGSRSAWLAAVASRDRGAVVVWAVAPLFAAAILLGVLFFFAHRAGRRAVNDLDFKLEHPPSAAVQVVAPPPTADVELVAP